MFRRIAVSMIVVALFVGVQQAKALDIGDKAPDFTALGVDDKQHSLADASKDSNLVVVCFTCNQCPVAVAYEDRFIDFNKKYQDKKVAFIALNCNNKTEGLDAMKARAKEKDFNFVYAFDKSAKAAKEYGAGVTPELFVVKDDKIVYHGAFDDSMNEPETSHLVNAVDALLAGKTPEVAETKAFGCGIKAD
ncbi:MAG: redoxin domain-containing protein [Planctomycetales bacterium]